MGRWKSFFPKSEVFFLRGLTEISFSGGREGRVTVWVSLTPGSSCSNYRFLVTHFSWWNWFGDSACCGVAVCLKCFLLWLIVILGLETKFFLFKLTKNSNPLPSSLHPRERKFCESPKKQHCTVRRNEVSNVSQGQIPNCFQRGLILRLFFVFFREKKLLIYA